MSDSDRLFVHRDLPPEGNREPEYVTDAIGSVSDFFASYGWYLIFGIMGLLYLRHRYGSQLSEWQEKRETAHDLSKYDAADVLAREEAKQQARKRMQEEHDAKAALHQEKQRQREEEKKREQIEDWERHKQGQGYRSKKLTRDNGQSSDQAAAASSQAKDKKPKLRQGYNPLMGVGGGSGFRPASNSRNRGG